ncbi:MAG TPA: hypothetical protein VFA32_19300 [Dehalococcoidia bacterium]|nr:hypothetical protein [Dehalococcoidia bacterium]
MAFLRNKTIVAAPGSYQVQGQLATVTPMRAQQSFLKQPGQRYPLEGQQVEEQQQASSIKERMEIQGGAQEHPAGPQGQYSQMEG